MTHGHEPKGGNVGGRWCAGRRGIKRGKWDDCNSIINKIYLKKKQDKQLEQEQNHRNGDHMEGYQQGTGRKREGEKVQRISSINSK